MTINEIPISEWEESLSDYSFSLFITPPWLSAMENDSCKAIYIDLVKRNQVVAKIAGLITKGHTLKGKQLYFYAAPALKGANQAVYDECCVALRHYAQNKGIARLIIGSYDQQNSLLTTAEGFFQTPRYEYVVDFQSGQPIHFSTGFKKNVKKAEKAGTTFHHDRSLMTLDKMLNLMGVTRDLRELKYGKAYNPFYLPNLNADSLQRLLDNGMGVMYYTLTDGRVHSVQFNIEYRGKVYGLLMGSDNYAYQNGLPSFVDYHLIEHYRQHGFIYYNPGGGPEGEGGEGIEKYKKALGGTRIDMAGATTNFLTIPHNVLNPIMCMGRKLPDNNRVVSFLKSLV
ncbi:acetyltransferase (GNAT) family protein [Breznakibacter xylanolyticus]|uniref:Acetyltransferase (GNAT) family protein n=2 Tax=Breznakibacter xylanolyticus TaxID=990 RepID=A0A2W7PVH3_9BACT|nr:acetyltransferase (GNAT) family protein [Breznakibacter xylanolyticus]